MIARAEVRRDRILLTDVQSVDWQSLTLTGERHQIGLRIAGPQSLDAVERMCAGLEDAQFNITGVIVADIAVADGPERLLDGSTRLTIEALTVLED